MSDKQRSSKRFCFASFVHERCWNGWIRQTLLVSRLVLLSVLVAVNSMLAVRRGIAGI